MGQLHPTLWRTCRVIASETRLQLLWLLFSRNDLCISELASLTGISDPNASIQLRSISSRGLITPYRNKMKVFYQPEVNTEVAHAEALLAALRACYENNMSFDQIIRQATAFTDRHRIQIVHALADKMQTFSELQGSLHFAEPTLSYHLAKLSARGFVRRDNGVYRIKTPSNSLGRVLLKLAKISS